MHILKVQKYNTKISIWIHHYFQNTICLTVYNKKFGFSFAKKSSYYYSPQVQKLQVMQKLQVFENIIIILCTLKCQNS